jgi:glutaminyl-peptide cyclotransferase
VRHRLLAAFMMITCACAPTAPAPAAAVPEYGVEIVHEYPHDPAAFTEGLVYQDGVLWESTGLEGMSSIRKLKLETGQELQRADLPPIYFGEGIVLWHGKDGKDKLIQLTYKTQVGFVYDLPKLTMLKRFEYPGEGWAMTHDGKRIIMSDGTPQLRFWDPETLAEQGRLTVTDNGKPLADVNELEYVKGEIYANVWQTERIARIDPKTGRVIGWIDLGGILGPEDRNGNEDVLNGIAYDAKGDRLFVTGKKWSKIYEIKLVKKR